MPYLRSVSANVSPSENAPDRIRLTAPVKVLTPAEAILAQSEYVDAAHCAGRILAEPYVCMPPCVPPYVCGEVLGEDAAAFVRGRVRVVTEPVHRTHR